MKDNVFNSLPIIAHAIARKCGVRVRCGGAQAYTDGNIVQLPESGTVPRNALLGYLVHECAHVRYTDFSIAYSNDLVRWLTNVYEDTRIERKIRKAYLGASRLLMATMRYLQQEPQQPIQSTLDALLRFVALDCWCRHRNMTDVLDSELERCSSYLIGQVPNALLETIRQVNDKIPTAKSTKDCVLIAEEVVGLLQVKQQPNGQSSSSSNENHGTTEKVSSERTPSDAFGPEAKAEEVSKPNTSNGKPSNEQGCSDDVSMPSACSQPTEAADQNKDVPASLDSFFDISARMKSEIETHQSVGQGSTALLPDGPLGMVMARNLDFSDKARAVLESGKRNSIGLRRQLQGLVQARGRTQKRLSNGGRNLNSQKLTRLCTWNPRVFNRWTEHPCTATAVHLLVDMSGSMRGVRERVAAESAIALFLALHSLPDCNPAISIFQGRGRTVGVLRHGEALTESTKSRLSVFEATGGTPLFRALGDVLIELSQTKEKRKVIFVITDGDPDQPHETHRLVKTIEKCPDLDIVGIGICSETSWLFEKSVRLDDISALPDVLFGLAKDMALAGIH